MFAEPPCCLSRLRCTGVRFVCPARPGFWTPVPFWVPSRFFIGRTHCQRPGLQNQCSTDCMSYSRCRAGSEKGHPWIFLTYYCSLDPSLDVWTHPWILWTHPWISGPTPGSLDPPRDSLVHPWIQQARVHPWTLDPPLDFLDIPLVPRSLDPPLDHRACPWVHLTHP